MSKEEKHILNTEELSPEDKKKFKDYEKRLNSFQAALTKLEEKYHVRAQMSYHMVYADLKLYEKVDDKKKELDDKVEEVITEAVDKTINKE